MPLFLPRRKSSFLMTRLNLYTCTYFLLRFQGLLFAYDCVSSLTLFIFYIYHYNTISGDDLTFAYGKNYVISALQKLQLFFTFFTPQIIQFLYFPNLKTSNVNVSGCATWFVLNLVRYPEDMFCFPMTLSYSE